MRKDSLSVYIAQRIVPLIVLALVHAWIQEEQYVSLHLAQRDCRGAQQKPWLVDSLEKGVLSQGALCPSCQHWGLEEASSPLKRKEFMKAEMPGAHEHPSVALDGTSCWATQLKCG
ncbi:uncharacterized protein LOC746315 [Pan troglodytes]|uniref:uncharacterized protein LOC746315 n=1 Tax=Pan troglodytes TaxID=9598 RepID=UPI003013965C